MNQSNPPLTQALKEGDRALDFNLANTDGAIFRLSRLAAERPIILVFYRGDW